jgi:outer membrane protein OmpA-like peptidoglycan-associated protein
MATSVMDSLQGLVTPQLLSDASSRLDEPESAVSKGLRAAFPLILGGLMQKLNDPNLISQIMGLLTNRANNSDLLAHPEKALAGEQPSSGPADLGARLLSTVFGTQTGATTGALAEYAGVKSSSASSLMTLAGTLVTGLLGDRVRRDGLNASALSGLLSGQRDRIVKGLPGSLTNVAGLGALRDIASRVTAPSREARTDGSLGWLWAAAAVLLLALGAWALWGRQEAPQVAATASKAVGAAQDAVRRSGEAAGDAAQRAGQAVTGAAQQAGQAAADAANAAGDVARRAGQGVGRAASDAVDQGQIALAALGSFTTRRLPTNVELSVPERGIESTVIAYLDDPSQGLDEELWFNFDRLLFETGSATLKPESQEQLKNVAEIMKAYPTVELKIGGYTDNVGDPAANVELSQDRATNVRTAIVALGIASERLSAEGYGEQFPVADNATPEGRQQNRRIALRVTKK